MAVDREKIKKEGMELVEKFSKKLEEIPEVNETHYVADLKNVTREDKKGKRKDFRKKLEKNAPQWKDGHVVAEKGK